MGVRVDRIRKVGYIWGRFGGIERTRGNLSYAKILGDSQRARGICARKQGLRHG